MRVRSRHEPTVVGALIGAGSAVIVALAGIWANVRNTRVTTDVSRRAVEAARRTVEITEQGQVTDRYAKAIEQLGSDKLEVRIGGIYALERVTRDSARDHPTVMEVLTAFIREQRPPQVPDEEQPRSTWPDVQAAVTVVGRRALERDIGFIDLSGADLSGANLTEAKLSGANLTEANLSGANLTGAILASGHLNGANLARARLIGAHLIGADLSAADLTRADLTGANLTGANLPRATLAIADFTSAKLASARLNDADLTRAKLARADLTGAHLRGAKLTLTNLAEAKLTDAVLTGAVLTSTVLHLADLSPWISPTRNGSGTSPLRTDGYQTPARVS